MTQRERSVLIAFTATVAALAALLGALKIVGSSDSDALVADQAQFISNDGNESDVTALQRSGADLDLRSAADDTGSTSSPLAPSSTVVSLPGDSSSVPAPAAPTTAVTPKASSTTAPTSASATTPTVPAGSSSATTAAGSTTASIALTTSTTVATTQATTDTTVPTTAPTSTAPPSTAPPSNGMQAIELEVLRLTNQLRADPSGPLARRKALPDCVNNAFYGITIDGATGHPNAVLALTLNESVSVQLARAWSIEMDRTDNFAHRSNASAAAIYSQLGIKWSATGENIAWFRGYPDSQAAQIFFEGWRESDTGHYCAMVASTYTHIGVGYFKGAASSWATQNFYR